MGSRDRRGGLLEHVRTLFDSGTTGGLSDGELLGRLAESSARGDAAGPAFAALVDRHGPMVLRVCRSILRDEHDAEDAFQAAFLILVRRADAVRRRESAGSWLHGVALRVAAAARAGMARRRRHERRAGELTASADRSGAEGISPELAAILHQELGRLPERYRAALVLCYLEGHTCEAAARRLGWPVGTVKSRLARGRERLRRRLLRLGLVPDDASRRVEATRNSGLDKPGEGATRRSLDAFPGLPPAPATVVPAALEHTTVEAMFLFASGRPIAGVVSATSLSWTAQTLRTVQMTRLAMISALLILCIAATGAAMIAAQEREPAGTLDAATAKTVSREREPTAPAPPEKESKKVIVRVVDPQGQGVPDVEVKVVDLDGKAVDDSLGYRTGADGRVWVAIGHHRHGLVLEARPNDRFIGWVRVRSDLGLPKATHDNPVVLTLLSRNHQVEGTLVDTRGKPVNGVQVCATQFHHEANGFVSDYRHGDVEPSLASAVTDLAGRYRLSLPEDTTASLAAYHPRFVGPIFRCGPEGQTIPAVTLEDAGWIAGTVVDAATGQPVAGAQVGAGRIEEIVERILVSSGHAVSDAQGNFVAGGLAPGVYNVVLRSSPRGPRLTARAVEGVRVKPGEEARADLRVIAGRRLHGTAVEAGTGKPLVGASILCYNASHPRSGSGCQGTETDERGRFEYFVPPGPAYVYINVTGRGITRNVPDDGDPEPVVLKQGYDPNAKPPPAPSLPRECEVRVRVKTSAGGRPAQKEDRSLTGRVFDQWGTPLVAVHVYYNYNRTLVEGATDRFGMFRLNGLPDGPSELDLRRNGELHGWARVPPEAVEIDVILPQ